MARPAFRRSRGAGSLRRVQVPGGEQYVNDARHAIRHERNELRQSGSVSDGTLDRHERARTSQFENRDVTARLRMSGRSFLRAALAIRNGGLEYRVSPRPPGTSGPMHVTCSSRRDDKPFLEERVEHRIECAVESTIENDAPFFDVHDVWSRRLIGRIHADCCRTTAPASRAPTCGKLRIDGNCPHIHRTLVANFTAICDIAFGTRIAIHRVMSPDVFETKRCRVDHVLQLLDDAAVRLRSRSHVSLVLLNDAVEFLTASENAALDDAQTDDDRPPLSACLEQHWAARLRLTAMQEALLSLNLGDASAASRFADVAREYVQLRREHMRLDDRLFASALKAFPKSMAAAVPSDAYESVTMRRLYERLVETPFLGSR
jgi:hypothetical protein